MGLEEEVPRFGLGPYQRGGPSSFVRGGEGSLLYFWEDPRDDKTYLVATQAPYIIRRIQRTFGSNVDGRYGSTTANAIVRSMRESGDPAAANASAATEATPGVLSYALLQSMHGGHGRIAFPSPTQFPDVDAAPLAPGSSTAIRVIDVSTGRNVPIVSTSATEWEPLRPSDAPPAEPAPAEPATTIRTGIIPGAEGTFAQVSPCGAVQCQPVRWEDPTTYPRTLPANAGTIAVGVSGSILLVTIGAVAATAD